MTKPYAFTIELTQPLAAAVETLRAALTAEPDIAALLPCGCGVSEATPGRAHIVLQDSRFIAAASDHPDVRAACESASATLRRVIDRLAATV